MRGRWGEGGGGGLELVIFFTKNPNLKYIKRNWGVGRSEGGGEEGLVCGCGDWNKCIFFTMNPNLKLKKKIGGWWGNGGGLE